MECKRRKDCKTNSGRTNSHRFPQSWLKHIKFFSLKSIWPRKLLFLQINTDHKHKEMHSIRFIENSCIKTQPQKVRPFQFLPAFQIFLYFFQPMTSQHQFSTGLLSCDLFQEVQKVEISIATAYNGPLESGKRMKLKRSRLQNQKKHRNKS